MKRWIILSCTAALGIATVCQGMKYQHRPTPPKQLLSKEQITNAALESMRPLITNSSTVNAETEPTALFDQKSNVIPGWRVVLKDCRNRVRAYASFDSRTGEMMFFGRPRKP